MDARLRISRLSGWARYGVVLDGGDVSTLGRGGSLELDVASGAHTLQLSYRPGLESTLETFSVRAGETAAFTCHPPSLAAAIPRLVAVALLRRGSWIALARHGHHGGGGDDTPTEPERDLVTQVQAAQNQPGLPH